MDLTKKCHDRNPTPGHQQHYTTVYSRNIRYVADIAALNWEPVRWRMFEAVDNCCMHCWCKTLTRLAFRNGLPFWARMICNLCPMRVVPGTRYQVPGTRYQVRVYVSVKCITKRVVLFFLFFNTPFFGDFGPDVVYTCSTPTRVESSTHDSKPPHMSRLSPASYVPQ